jgi:hypothetical protein
MERTTEGATEGITGKGNRKNHGKGNERDGGKDNRKCNGRGNRRGDGRGDGRGGSRNITGKAFFAEIILTFRIFDLSLCALKTIRAPNVRGVAQSG